MPSPCRSAARAAASSSGVILSLFISKDRYRMRHIAGEFVAMEKPLAGQRAIVFGGGSGIGLGSARMLARDGAHVTISGRTEQKLIDAAAALADEGCEVSYFAADANDGAQVSAAVD